MTNIAGWRYINSIQAPDKKYYKGIRVLTEFHGNSIN